MALKIAGPSWRSGRLRSIEVEVLGRYYGAGQQAVGSACADGGKVDHTRNFAFVLLNAERLYSKRFETLAKEFALTPYLQPPLGDEDPTRPGQRSCTSFAPASRRPTTASG